MNVAANLEKEKKEKESRSFKSHLPRWRLCKWPWRAEPNLTLQIQQWVCLISILIYPNDCTQSTMYAEFYLIKDATFRVIIHLFLPSSITFFLSAY